MTTLWEGRYHFLMVTNKKVDTNKHLLATLMNKRIHRHTLIRNHKGIVPLSSVYKFAQVETLSFILTLSKLLQRSLKSLYKRYP